MHHVYTTPAFVVSSAPYGEAGKSLLLFSRDFGMIWATAQGIRLHQSKLRHHVQDYSFSYVSVVRGREMWRLTGAVEFKQYTKPSKLYVRILGILKRLLPGEEKNEKLFDVIEKFHEFLEKGEGGDKEFIEILTMLRILDCLGYVREKTPFESVLLTTDFDSSALDLIKQHKTYAVKEINNALKESQL